jgi:hypothetical protein
MITNKIQAHYWQNSIQIKLKHKLVSIPNKTNNRYKVIFFKLTLIINLQTNNI